LAVDDIQLMSQLGLRYVISNYVKLVIFQLNNYNSLRTAFLSNVWHVTWTITNHAHLRGRHKEGQLTRESYN